ncbi:hypothetical protein AB0M79_28295 [Polymorphospora sp. NPDC051019]|uniref:hypothetical protein n=1 Tax=Polymorphospora sp. NPDC051019 TaxID=3155725 RepID=UPI003441C26B
MTRPHPVAAAMVVGLCRVVDLGQDDVIRLPARVFLPVEVAGVRDGESARWSWQHRSASEVPGVHEWRMVYDLDNLDDEDASMLNRLPSCFRPLRVAADEVDQGGEFGSVVLALHEFDLVEIQVRLAWDRNRR